MKVGGCGMFQILAYFAVAFGMSGPSWFIYEVGYLTQSPENYFCTNAEGVTYSCTQKDICASDSTVVSFEADQNDSKFLYNWQQKLDLTCTKDWVVGMIGASLFIGWCTTLLWLPALADKYGRKPIFFIGMCLDLVFYVGLLVTTKLWVMILIWFLFGMVCSVRI